MPLATGLALGLAGISAAGAVGGAALSSHAAGKAAGAQADAANYAASLQHQDAQAALDFQKQQYNTNQSNFAPWLNTGRGALMNLANLLGIDTSSFSGTPRAANGPSFTATGGNAPTSIGNRLLNGDAPPEAGPSSHLMRSGIFDEGGAAGPTGRIPTATPRPLNGRAIADKTGENTIINPQGTPTAGPGSAGFGSLLKGWDTPFNAPTDITEQNDPGFKARLGIGQQLLENSAASRGGLLSTGTAKNLQQFGQDYASNEYSNVYNRALGEYQQQYNIFNNNQTNEFNRLAALSGVGQTAASNLSSSGQAAANNIGSILLGSGQQIGNSLQNAGAARASGYVGGANAWSGALGGIGGNIGQMLLLQQLLGKNAAPTGEESY